MRSRARGISLLSGVLVTLAIVLVPLIGHDPATPRSTTQRGFIAVAYSPPWKVAPVIASQIYGIRFHNELVLTRGRKTIIGGSIVNGSPIPGGIPSSFSRRIAGPPSRHIVRLNDDVAVRYSGRSLYGARRLALYVLPTDRGDLGLLCLSTRPSSDQNPCAIDTLALTIRGRRVVPPGADQGLARSLAKALKPVDETRSEPNLVALDSATAIADAMDALAGADKRAASQVEMLTPDPRDRRAVMSGVRAPLTAEAQALMLAAGYARAEESTRYEEAAESAMKISRRLHSGVLELHEMGFSLPHLAPLDLPQLPRPESFEQEAGTGPTEQVTNSGAEGTPSGQGQSGSGGSSQTEPTKPLESKGTEPAKPIE